MILARHLNAEALRHMLGLSASILLIVALHRMTLYLGDVASGGLAPGALGRILLYRLPDFLQTLLPLALFLGILLPLGRLHEEGALGYLPVAGVNLRRLALWLSPTIAIGVAALAALSLWLTPMSADAAHRALHGPQGLSALGALAPGRFRMSDKERVVSYFDRHDEGRTGMRGPLFVRLYDDDLELVSVAERASLRWQEQTHFLDLDRGRHYFGAPGRADYRLLDFARHSQTLGVAQSAGRRALEAETMSSAELWASERADHRAHWHWRAGLPAMALALGLCALGFGRFAPRRTGRLLPVFAALASYILYWLALTSLRAASEDAAVSPVAMWGVHALFAALGAALLFRAEWAVRWRSWRNRRRRRRTGAGALWASR